MDILVTPLKFIDAGEFQYWHGILQIGLKNGMSLEVAIGQADEAVKAARDRIPIVTSPPTGRQ